MKRILMGMALCAQAGLLQAEVQVVGTVEYGLFETRHEHFEPGQRVLTRQNQRIIPGQEIPARLGSKFGLRYQLSGKQPGEPPLTLLYLTPGVVTPDGQRHDKFVVTQALSAAGQPDLVAFEFSEPHEVVPGEWHFMVFQGDRKLLEQRFQVR